MKRIQNFQQMMTTGFRSLSIVALVAAMASCTNDNEFIPEPAAPAVEEAASVSAEGEEGASLTVSGAFVEYRDGDLCSECTYVIPEDATIVDGEKIGVKPGDVICLNSSFAYKAVELINVDGEDGNPVVVANCGE